jgi:ribosomal protein S6
LLRFESQQDLIPRLEGQFKLNERVIRYLIVHFDEQSLRLETEQAKRKEELIQASAARAERRDAAARDDDDDDEPAHGARSASE